MNNGFSHPEWSYSTNIYEVNVRQYTVEGSFEAFSKHLPRLKDMGIEILWFMPITPISKKDMKGTLGSYYAVQDYEAVNPEFGTIEDFKQLIADAHSHGFKVIIDWVANHTGNDHIWMIKHPDFFCYNDSGKILNPHGWEDVSQLNYNNPNLYTAMIDAMKFWITTCDIDGFRCDMAHLVPLDFWMTARKKLEEIKPELFWLAECEESNYHEVFDATYTWEWMHKTEEFFRNNLLPNTLIDLLFKYNRSFPADAFRVYFTSNHDENSWNGSEYEKYGDAAKALSVFSCTWNGLPMIYSGQELPNYKRLNFFDKDFIEWNGKFELHDFYKNLFGLRKKNVALRAGDEKVKTYILSSENSDKIFAYVRKHTNHSVLVILNLCSDVSEFSLKEIDGPYTNIFTGEVIDLSINKSFKMKEWEYLVFESNVFN